MKTTEDVAEAISQLLQRLSMTDWLAVVKDYHKEVVARNEKARAEYERIMDQEEPCSQCRKLLRMRDLCGGQIGDHTYNHLCPVCFEQVKAEYTHICVLCGVHYFAKVRSDTVDLCYLCRKDGYVAEYHRVVAHNRRAQEQHLRAELSLRQWLATLDYFEWKCAYCCGRFYGIEHYLPLSLDGGTTADNCLPCCKSCNTRKGDKHPDEFTSLFPAENMARIRLYLEQAKQS